MVTRLHGKVHPFLIVGIIFAIGIAVVVLGMRVNQDSLLPSLESWYQGPGIHADLTADFKQIVDNATEIEVLKLQPLPGSEEYFGRPYLPNTFYGCKILKTAKVTNTDERKKLAVLFEKNVETRESRAFDFGPHYGLRFNSSGTTVDFAIDFGATAINGHLGQAKEIYLGINKDLLPALDQILAKKQ